MGPMKGAGADVLVIVLLVVLIVVPLTIGTIAIVFGLRQGHEQPAALSAADVLRARYARGELSQTQYREALLDILKDRYTRGEIDLEDYEARSQELLTDGRPMNPVTRPDVREADDASSDTGE